MIKTVIVTNFLGESLELPLTSPEESGLVIMEIKGLDPPKASINTSEAATMDGTRYNSARMDQRNIVFKFKLLDQPTIEEVRHDTYRYFPLKKPVRLDFLTDTRNAYINGYVESNEPMIFSKFETSQISIICPDPYFRSSDSNGGVQDMSIVTSMFEFAYENPIGPDGNYREKPTATEDFPTINSGLTPVAAYSMEQTTPPTKATEFSTVKDDAHCSFWYPGDIETGVTIRVHAKGPVSGLILWQEDPLGVGDAKKISLTDSVIEAITGSGIVSGDDIEISTVKGQKHAWLTRGNVSYNILNALGMDIDWFELSHGTNIFFSQASSELALANAQIRIYYTVLYEGL